MLTACWRTHPGNVRATNEDSVLWDEPLGLLVVADGMGGHNAGEVASQLAVETLHGFLQKSATTCEEMTWPFGVDPALSFAANRLLTAVKIANRCVYRSSEQTADYTGMGTTIVAGLADDAHLTFTGVGDSRIYTLYGSELRQLTADDSWIVMLQRESGLDASAYSKHPMRHVLTSVVGARPELTATVDELTLVDGQILMFCSDGLHGAVPDALITSTLQSESDLGRAADRLVETALSRDGSDNITVLLARYTT